MSIKTILIGTAFGQTSDGVVATGVRLAHAVGAQVHLVHALEVPAIAELPADSQGIRAKVLRHMDEQLERARVLQGVAIGSVSRHVVVARADRALADVASECNADLVVVGAAESPLAPLFGSTAGRVVRKARCPVLVVRERLALPPARVLLPIDLSPLSAELVERGFEILDQIGTGAGGSSFARRDLDVEAFHCVVPIGHEGFVPLFDPSEVTREAVEQLDRLLVPQRQVGWRVETRGRFGGAREEILARIEAWRPDLVIVGTHGASGFERLLVGSVAQSVLERSRANVLVVPPLEAQAVRAAAA